MSNSFPSSDFGCKLLRVGWYFPAYWQWKKFLACKAWKGGDATDLDIHSRSYFPTFAERKTLKAGRRQWVIGKNRRSRPCQVKETQTIEWYRNQSEKVSKWNRSIPALKILEENGSKDFKYLPFLWGAAQSSLPVIVPEVPDYLKDILGRPSKTTWWIFSAKWGGVPPTSAKGFWAGWFSVKGGWGTPLAEKIRWVVFDGLPIQIVISWKALWWKAHYLVKLSHWGSWK